MTDTNEKISNEIRSASAQPAIATQDAARRTADAAQQSGRAASEASRMGADMAANVGRHGIQAGADTMRRVSEGASETLRRSTQAMADGHRQMAEDATKRFQETSRKFVDVARGTSEEMQSFFMLPTAAEGGWRDMHQSVAGIVEGVVQTNLRVTQEMFRLADPSAMIELQQRFMRDYLDALMKGTATLVHAIRRTADETLGPLEQRVEQRKQAHANEERTQRAA